jgi:hypothetical protein
MVELDFRGEPGFRENLVCPEFQVFRVELDFRDVRVKQGFRVFREGLEGQEGQERRVGSVFPGL